MNDERDTRELEFGTSTANVEASNSASEPKKENTNTTNGGNNSFYDRKPSSSSNSVWYKDWRGKSLFVSLAAIVLIGGGIPAGMAAAGYWGVKDWSPKDNHSTLSAYKLAENEINILYNDAVIKHYDDMYSEGWVTKTTHDNAINDAKDSADKTIDDAKKSLKDQYGNTWKEEWDKTLQEKGFHTAANGGEDEYKQSLIASSIESSVKSVYTNKNKAVEKLPVADAASSYIYSSTNGKDGKDYVVRNTYTNKTVDTYSYTPQDLMTMYLYTYQPMVFNNSLLPFFPVVGSGTDATLTGNNVLMTNEQIKNAWALAVKKNNDSEFVATDNFGGIQSRNAISFEGQSLGEEANIAVVLGLSGNAKSADTDIVTLVSNAFKDAGLDPTSITSDVIDYMDVDTAKTFTDSIASQLQKAKLLNAIEPTTGTPSGTRNFSTKGMFDANSVSFVSISGLYNIGVEAEGKSIIDEQLNNLNKDANARDFDLWTSYTSWVGTNFKTITLIDYLTDLNDDSNKSWFTYDKSTKEVDGINLVLNQAATDWFDHVKEVNKDATDKDGNLIADKIVEQIKNVELEPIISSQLTQIASSYNAAKTFVQTNKKYYDYTTFSTDTGKCIIDFYESTNKGHFVMLQIDSITTPTRAEVVLNKGGDQ